MPVRSESSRWLRPSAARAALRSSFGTSIANFLCRDYLGLKLDDPSFTSPIYANLVSDESGEGYSLIWSRPSRRNGD
jgi:Protein of unknown function (DUF736)